MIQRLLGKKMRELAGEFPVISLTGPRQSGKTTLVKAVFPKYKYVSLEDLDTRERAKEDPRGFLKSFQHGVILDEIQRVPELFSYIQTAVDASKRMGQFILTGSQNFLILEKIGQSLAGRVAVLHLLPLSLEEIQKHQNLEMELDTFIFNGMYPALYDRKISVQTWHSSYITTYIERDVRQIKQVADLDAFQKFMKLCAGRSGQLLNLSGLGNECGITHTTAKSWISVLQASFIVFLLQPFHKNFNKRIVKQPKLYFYDTGLLCALLGIQEASQLHTHYYRGALFETFIVSELIKYAHHRGKAFQGYFWRDHRENEVDCIIEDGNKLVPIEIKSGATVSADFFKSLRYFNGIIDSHVKNSFVIYGGNDTNIRKYGKAVSWIDLTTIFKTHK